MLLVFHIISATVSAIIATYLLFRPSKTVYRATYGLMTTTLVSGTYLVWSTRAHLISSCMTGLIYLGIISFALSVARFKLAKQKVTNKE